MVPLRSRLLALALLSLVEFVAAAPSPFPSIPPVLAPWIPWVLRDAGDEICPSGRDGRHCEALSVLDMSVRGSTASFVLSGTLWKAGFVELPGDSSLWPEDVKGASGALPAISREQRPAVFLGKGDFRVSGNIRWTRRPASIALPVDVALERLDLEGRMVEAQDGQLWLRRDAEDDRPHEGDSAGSVEMKVYRTVRDGVPVRMETRLVLSVSGAPRRLDLSGILPKGSLPLDLASDLPARFTREGRLSLTVRPGRWSLVVGSAWLVPPERFQASRTGDPWPEEEVWSFEAAPEIRSVQLSGGRQVDALQAGVRPEDATYPAWGLPRGGSLDVKEVLRGDPVTDSVKMRLSRSVWVDFAGGGATVSDRMMGDVLRPLRLSAGVPLRLGRATVDGEGVVLTGIDSSEQGFPLSAGAHEVALLSRWNDGLWSALPATPTGWEYSSGRMEVHLGPGWRLLDLLGPGASYGTWASEWNLWSIFLVVLGATLLGRFAGLWVGIGSGALFVMGWHDGIGTGWWVHLAVTLLVWNVVAAKFPGSRTERVARIWAMLAAACLVMALVPFTIEQARRAVHPMLVEAGGVAGAGHGFGTGKMEAAAPAMEEGNENAASTETRSVGVAKLAKAPSPAMQNSVMDKIQANDGLLGEEVGSADASAIDAILANGGTRQGAKVSDDPFLVGGVQSGPGTPDWDYGTGTLEWEGPVAPSQTVRILALSPGWVRLWRVLELVGAWLLLFLLLRRAAPGVASRIRLPVGRKLSPLALVLALAASASAQMPSPEMLGQLKEHLLKAPECGDACARVGAARISLRGDAARVELDVHAAARGMVALPAVSWIPTGLVVARGAAGREADGTLWAVVEPGIQTIRMEGVAKGDDLLVSFPSGDDVSLPFRRTLDAPGWRREGDDPRSVHLVRVAGAVGSSADSRDSTSADLAPLVRITRSLDLQREWTMTTTVDRVSSFSGAIALDVPLLAGENVVDNLATDSLHVKAVLPAGVDEIGWSSSLPIGSRLFLRAESTSLWTETWTLKASPRWHVAPSGLPRIQAGELTWMPVVGETLSVVVEVPKPVAGPLLTIESARLDVSNGRDLSEVGLVAQVLAGIGGELFVGLPDSARVRSVKLDGEERNPLRGSDGRYRIEVSPGEHEVEVHWIQGGIGSVFRKAPRVELSASGTNATVVLSAPASGWIVAMGGPGAGPAVLWWGVFAAMVVFALGLSRIPGQPLGFWSWLLLFAGTSTVNHLTMLPFAAWVVAMVLRSKAKPEAWSRQVFRLVQIGCVLLAAIAWGWILATIPQGLLGRPDMLIEAPGWEHAWFLDRIDGTLPRPWEVVLPLWLWRSLLLAWSLWLAFSCVKWAIWGWNAVTAGGLWPERAKKAVAQADGDAQNKE